MTPGPTKIRECSTCGKHIAQHTIASGNTIGARYWTDGKRDAPMLPDQPWLVKCQHCGILLWIDEQKQVGEIDPWASETDASISFADARPALTPTLQEYAAFLETGESDRNKERYVRLCVWWAGNDPRRETGTAIQLDALEIQNLRAFLALLDETDETDRLMKAEVLRELGEFHDAETLLATTFHEGFTPAVTIIRGLIQKGNTTVAEMKSI